MSGTACQTVDHDYVEAVVHKVAPPPARSRRILKFARIIFNNAYCGIDCIVLDLTPDGAMLQADDAHLCPDTFHLKMLSGEVYACLMDRRDGIKIRFKILTNPRQDQPVEELRATV